MNGTGRSDWNQKSKGPLKWYSVGMWGIVFELRRRLRLICTWVNILHHECRGKFLSHELRELIKWVKKVFIDRSAMLEWWLLGGTSWWATFAVWRSFKMELEASLSISIKLSCKFFFIKSCVIYWKIGFTCWPDLEAEDHTMMALDS